MNPENPMAAAADRIILATLPHIAFEGWSPKALRAGAAEYGFDETMLERALPGGVLEAVERFAALADRQLEEAAAEADFSTMHTGQRVGWLVRKRLEPWIGQREAVRRAVTYLAMPGHQAAAARSAWHTADTIWHCAGDPATDISWYTKRATLLAVYTATLLVWLEDRSEDCTETWAFLDRRLASVAKFGKWRGGVQKKLESLPGLLQRNPFKVPARKRVRI